MRITWRDDKARRNKQKHGLEFGLAKHVFADPLCAILPDRVVDGEERWHAIGAVNYGLTFKILPVVHCYPEPEDESHVCVISLRNASPDERRRYRDRDR